MEKKKGGGKFQISNLSLKRKVKIKTLKEISCLRKKKEEKKKGRQKLVHDLSWREEKSSAIIPTDLCARRKERYLRRGRRGKYPVDIPGGIIQRVSASRKGVKGECIIFRKEKEEGPLTSERSHPGEGEKGMGGEVIIAQKLVLY